MAAPGDDVAGLGRIGAIVARNGGWVLLDDKGEELLGGGERRERRLALHPQDESSNKLPAAMPRQLETRSHRADAPRLVTFPEISCRSPAIGPSS